jgi:hypothetical protein
MAAPEGTVVSGAIGPTRAGRMGRLALPRPAPWLDRRRLHSGVAGLQGRLILQVVDALRATRGKPFPHTEAVPRWHPHSSDSMWKGGTHMLREAGLVILIQCVIVYDKSPKLIIRCHAACKQDRAFRPSLAPHDGQRRKYQCYRRRVGIRLRLISLAGPDHAA